MDDQQCIAAADVDIVGRCVVEALFQGQAYNREDDAGENPPTAVVATTVFTLVVFFK